MVSDACSMVVSYPDSHSGTRMAWVSGHETSSMAIEINRPFSGYNNIMGETVGTKRRKYMKICMFSCFLV